MQRDLIMVGGPTASGKSALALAIAREFEGTVINADAMQVYSGLAILTNRPGAEDEAAAPHRLFGILPPGETCSAGRWRALALDACTESWRAGRLPVVVGGTGLYLRALASGLAPVPPVPASVRAASRVLLAELGVAALHARLAERDPAMAARLRPSDSQRVVRAWEVIEATGRSLAEWQKEPSPDAAELRAFRILVSPPRAELYSACDARFLAMIERGALDEVRGLMALGLDPALPAMKALGVRELAAHLAGKLSLGDAVVQAQAATRRYAKRQTTWFRHQWLPNWTLFAQFSERHRNEIFTKIRESLLTGR